MTALASAPAVRATPGEDFSTTTGPLPDEVRSSFDFLPATLAGYAAGVVVVLLWFWGVAPGATLLAWVAGFAVMGLSRTWIGWRFRQATPVTPAEWQRWRKLSNLGTLGAGLLWGLAGWMFYLDGNATQQTGLIVLIYTFAVAAVPVLSTQPRLFLAFVLLCFSPLILRIASVGTPDHLRLAAELVLIISLTTVLARYYRASVQRVIALKAQADELLLALREQSQAAEAARQAAEVANRAKTQFFSAASHDLRQPLHAMGLFAEALRQRVSEPEVASLVNSINESVDALEGLFTELLDITRIDSGGVQVQARDFALADIFRRLRLHFEPAAFEKGLALRFRGGQHVVHADPLLVERILRNLVSNAIRYTEDGTVLVGCRLQAGGLRLQVWDSGRGIAPDEQAAVFEEFYQVPLGEAAPAQQRKGLGLGLAIVQRLAALMGAPLTLRSQLGRGTVFSLSLPRGREPKTMSGPRSRPGLAELVLTGRHIVIVEDEPAVRAGLEVLLQGWGASLTVLEGGAAAARWAGEVALAPGPRPDLLIADYRLEPGFNGIGAIGVLRGQFGAGLPAIMVTGSMLSGLEVEAQANDFHILVKPVLPNKLRSMIAFKLGLGASAGPATGA